MNIARINSFLNWQIKVGRVLEIPIYLHITLIFFLWPAFAGRGLGFGYSVEYAFLIVFTILLHEFGHALAAKAYGLSGLSITLHGFGGFATSSGPRNPRQDLIITLAGPAVTFVIGIACYFVGDRSLSGRLVLDSTTYQLLILRGVGIVNLWMGFMNLVPMLPLDGGHALRAILSFRLSEFKATRAVCHLGLILSVPMVIVGFIGDLGYLTIFGLIGLSTSVMTLLNTGGIRMNEFFVDRRLRKEEQAQNLRKQQRIDEYVTEVNARMKEREEKERLRKLLGE